MRARPGDVGRARGGAHVDSLAAKHSLLPVSVAHRNNAEGTLPGSRKRGRRKLRSAISTRALCKIRERTQFRGAKSGEVWSVFRYRACGDRWHRLTSDKALTDRARTKMGLLLCTFPLTEEASKKKFPRNFVICSNHAGPK